MYNNIQYININMKKAKSIMTHIPNAYSNAKTSGHCKTLKKSKMNAEVEVDMDKLCTSVIVHDID